MRVIWFSSATQEIVPASTRTKQWLARRRGQSATCSRRRRRCGGQCFHTWSRTRQTRGQRGSDSKSVTGRHPGEKLTRMIQVFTAPLFSSIRYSIYINCCLLAVAKLAAELYSRASSSLLRVSMSTKPRSTLCRHVSAMSLTLSGSR